MRKALLVAQLAVMILIARNWAYVTTYRLYLDQRVEAGANSAAVERFDIEGPRVVPQITTRGPERLAFTPAVGRDSTIHVELRPVQPSNFTIASRDRSQDVVLARGFAEAPVAIVAPYPGGSGVIELISDGPVVWADPRVVRNLAVGRHLVALAALVLAFLYSPPGHRTGRFAARLAVVVISTVATCAAIEAGLRMLADSDPPGIATERHDLGEVTRDPRWMDSPQYGRRLRPNVDVINEWRDGDIVRMGFMPPSLGEGILHRFRFQTDAEGFRNAAVRDRIEMAALGDSFTDAMTMAAEASWPSQLEKRLGVAVQNYGTAGFGPQQERLVLRDFASRHHPRMVVLAYFAGNDIFDAEAFEQLQREGGAGRAVPGWRIKAVFSRADTWFVTSALRATVRWFGSPHDAPLEASASPVLAARSAIHERVGGASFDRGLFTVPAGDRSLRFAFMPPYLNTLNFSEEELRHRAGWTQTIGAIRDMRSIARASGAEFVVLFLPFKSQVYLPLLESAFAPADLRAAFAYYLDIYGRPVDLSAMHRNRLAQNLLMRRFCDAEGIPYIDMTPALETQLRTGENVYFVEESHLNELGEAIVADTLAQFLRESQSSERLVAR